MRRHLLFTAIVTIVLTLPTAAFSADYCKRSIVKTIKCMKDKSIVKEMKKDVKDMIYHCKQDRYEIRRAKMCYKYRICSNFMRCIRGE